MTFSEIREYIRKPGVKVFCLVQTVRNNYVYAEIKKTAFLKAIEGFEGDSVNVVQTLGGDVLFGQEAQ